MTMYLLRDCAVPYSTVTKLGSRFCVERVGVVLRCIAESTGYLGM